MSESDKNVRSRLERFRAGDLSVEDLESWLYVNVESVEEVLGSALALDLRSTTFRRLSKSHVGNLPPGGA